MADGTPPPKDNGAASLFDSLVENGDTQILVFTIEELEKQLKDMTKWRDDARDAQKLAETALDAAEREVTSLKDENEQLKAKLESARKNAKGWSPIW